MTKGLTEVSTWARVSPQSPCAVCGKNDWCSVSADGTFAICRRRDDGTGRAKVDRGGAEYWVYRRADAAITPGPWATAPRPVASTLDPRETHRVYASILGALPLIAADRRGLRARGLPDDEINVRQYRSFARAYARDAVAAAVATFGRARCLSVPGVTIDRDGTPILSAAPGLIVPVRDHRGLIVALKVRRRTTHAPRYVYVSSTHAGGPGPGSPVHVPLHDERCGPVVRLTEGELKADVATVLSGLPTIAIAGVGSWRRAIPVLRAMNASICRLALDGDVLTNPHVARALQTMANHLVEEGFGLELELWDARFKGIDDCLAAGHAPRLLVEGDALAECNRLGDRLRERPADVAV